MYTCNPGPPARFPRYIFEIEKKAPLVLALLALVPDPLCALVSFPWPATS